MLYPFTPAAAAAAAASPAAALTLASPALLLLLRLLLLLLLRASHGDWQEEGYSRCASTCKSAVDEASAGLEETLEEIQRR